jgi:hypothetical protein
LLTALFRTPRRSLSRAAAIGALAFAAACGPVRGAEPGLPPEEGESRGDRTYALIEAGSAFAIGSKLGGLPAIGGFRDLPGSWQAGAQARFAVGPASTGYDYLPLASVSVRKLWLGDEDVPPIRNSEYFGVSLGAYFAYDFDGSRDGPRPMGAISLGKYWMPIDSRPLGLDLNLDLTTLKLPFFTSGHLTSHSEQVIVTCGVNLFYAFH